MTAGLFRDSVSSALFGLSFFNKFFLLFENIRGILALKGDVFQMKQKELSLWLRAIVVLCAVCVLALCVIFTLRLNGYDTLSAVWQDAPPRWMIGVMWLSVVPMVWFLILIWQIAGEIGRDNSFCMANAARLKTCSHLALADTVLYAAAAIAMALMEALIPRILLWIIVLLAVGVGMAVCCGALSHLTRKAAGMKEENDLTI